MILLGPPGVGKTHLAISLAIAAAQSGRRVYYGTLAGLIESLTEAKAAGNLSRRLRVLAHPTLLVVDEIGYLPVNQDGAVLFFQLINARHEKASTVLYQPAVRRMDRGAWLRTPDRRAPRPPHPSRQHPRDERRQLSAQPEPQASNPDGELNQSPSPRLTPWAHRPLPRAPPRQPVEGTPRCARGPPMDYGDKPAAARWSLFTPPRRSLFAPPLTG